MKLTLIRGLPGSGKTTLAKTLEAVHYEADMYFIRNGEYRFNMERLHIAHKWCLHATEQSMRYDMDVVVSNTFTTAKELKPYIALAQKYGYALDIITCTGKYESVHNVPSEVMAKMKARFDHTV